MIKEGVEFSFKMKSAPSALVFKETREISALHANLKVLLGIYTMLVMGVIAGTGWNEWCGNGWTMMHWYMPALPIGLAFLTFLPIETALHGEGTRRDYIHRTRELSKFSYYLLAIGALMESVAIAYLIQAHARSTVVLARSNGSLIVAYGISAAAMILKGALWYVVWRLDKHNTHRVAPGNDAVPLA